MSKVLQIQILLDEPINGDREAVATLLVRDILTGIMGFPEEDLREPTIGFDGDPVHMTQFAQAKTGEPLYLAKVIDTTIDATEELKRQRKTQEATLEVWREKE